MVPIPEGQAMVICPFCEQRSVVSGERGVRRYQVPLRVTREQALEAYQKFLSSNLAIARDARGKARTARSASWCTCRSGAPGAAGWPGLLAQQKVGSGEHTALRAARDDAS